jgi:hypothetical protein
MHHASPVAEASTSVDLALASGHEHHHATKSVEASAHPAQMPQVVRGTLVEQSCCDRCGSLGEAVLTTGKSSIVITALSGTAAAVIETEAFRSADLHSSGGPPIWVPFDRSSHSTSPAPLRI